MVILRCTQQLLQRLRKAPDAAFAGSTTTLGDWYGTGFQVGRYRYGLFISERSRLPVVLLARDLKCLPATLSDMVGQVLAALGVDEQAIALERGEMAEVVYAPTRSRSLVGSLNDFGFMTRMRLIGGRHVPPFDLSLELTEVPVGPMDYASPAQVTRELFGVKPKE